MKRRILLADDSVTIQKVIELTFMDEDFEVRAVSNGDEALALLPEVKPDFVIADVHMPGANGYEVCRRAKQLRSGVPVLLLVGTFEPFDENEARSAGADSFLKKPFDSQELLQRVQELLASVPQTPQTTAAAAAPPVTERTPLPTLDFPPVAGTSGIPGTPGAPGAPGLEPPSPVFSPEPAWGSFDLGPTPAAPAISQEPFDHEPSFALEPDPTYQVEQEPVFELEESATTFAVQGDVFGAPSELAFEEPQDRYLPEEPLAPAPAVAGFDWAADPTGPEPVLARRARRSWRPSPSCPKPGPRRSPRRGALRPPSRPRHRWRRLRLPLPRPAMAADTSPTRTWIALPAGWWSCWATRPCGTWPGRSFRTWPR